MSVQKTKPTIENRDYPSREALRSYYAQGWERIWIDELDDQLHPLNEGYRRRMEATFRALGLPDGSPATVLDAGCGIGIYAINLAKRWPQVQVVGFDISEKQIEIADRLAMEQEVAERCRFFVGDVNMIVLSETFDFVICSEVLEHLPNPSCALDNLSAMGTKRSVYVFSVPQLYHGCRKSGRFYKQLLPGGKELHTQDPKKIVEEVPVFEYYHALYRPRELVHLLEQQGFSINHVEGVDFTIPLLSAKPESGSSTRLVRKAFNLVVKALRAVPMHLSAEADGLLNLVSGNLFAANLIVRSRLTLE